MITRRLLLSVGVLATAQVTRAQFTFTINASPTADALGYVTTQNYNFAFTLNTVANTGNGPFQPGSATANSNYTWLQEWTMDPQIWTNVTGDGLAGTWTQPTANAADPFSKLVASTSSPTITLYGGADVSNVGLTAGGMLGSPVKWITFATDLTGLTFSSITGTLPDPNNYFASYTSSYAASSTTTGWIHATGGDAFFTVNSLSISASAIPEPSTYAAIAGAVMLGTAVWYRRRRPTPAATSAASAT